MDPCAFVTFAAVLYPKPLTVLRRFPPEPSAAQKRDKIFPERGEASPPGRPGKAPPGNENGRHVRNTVDRRCRLLTSLVVSMMGKKGSENHGNGVSVTVGGL